MSQTTDLHSGRVRALINYTAPMAETPRYHAMDTARDIHVLDPRVVAIVDSRAAATQPQLDREGFQLVRQVCAVTDFPGFAPTGGSVFSADLPAHPRGDWRPWGGGCRGTLRALRRALPSAWPTEELTARALRAHRLR